jgi:hypothetical protein
VELEIDHRKPKVSHLEAARGVYVLNSMNLYFSSWRNYSLWINSMNAWRFGDSSNKAQIKRSSLDFSKELYFPDLYSMVRLLKDCFSASKSRNSSKCVVQIDKLEARGWCIVATISFMSSNDVGETGWIAGREKFETNTQTSENKANNELAPSNGM